MTSLGLLIMCKDETAVLRRAIVSALAIVDHVTIVNTDPSAADHQQAILRETCALHETCFTTMPWSDFGTNRSMALQFDRVNSPCHYTLFLDADDVVETSLVNPPELMHDCYDLPLVRGGTHFKRRLIFKNKVNFYYRGVVHEFATCDHAHSVGSLDSIRVRSNREGSRANDPETYRKDAALLEEAIAAIKEPSLRPRYMFYLAQSYRDAGMQNAARIAYAARASLAVGWAQERYVAALETARIFVAQGGDIYKVLHWCAYAQAIDSRRREASTLAIRTLRIAKDYDTAMEWFVRHPPTTMPADGLFMDPLAYAVNLYDEAGVILYHKGQYKDALEATLTAMQLDTGNTLDKGRMLGNIRECTDKL